jgi:hypothetical protein
MYIYSFAVYHLLNCSIFIYCREEDNVEKKTCGKARNDEWVIEGRPSNIKDSFK